MSDHVFMHRCLALAAQARGKTGTNPLVGCVLVRNGQIIAEGYHEGFGMSHAERALLDSYTGNIDPDDVLYVNLEPCCHEGKTPPCTNYLIDKGVRHVVVGMTDPNPLVSGKGIAHLRTAGIKVTGPVCRAECEWQNRGFISLQKNGRPWITKKMAIDRAKLVSNVDGSFKKITSEEQDYWSHTSLRVTHDVIMVGVGTIIADNPKLNTRFVQGVTHQPYRIILDPDLRTPLGATVVSDDAVNRTLIICSHVQGPSREALETRGVHIFDVDCSEEGFDFPQLWSLLTNPNRGLLGISSILLEGGPTTWKHFEHAGVVDAEVTLVGGT